MTTDRTRKRPSSAGQPPILKRDTRERNQKRHPDRFRAPRRSSPSLKVEHSKVQRRVISARTRTCLRLTCLWGAPAPSGCVPPDAAAIASCLAVPTPRAAKAGVPGWSTSIHPVVRGCEAARGITVASSAPRLIGGILLLPARECKRLFGFFSPVPGNFRRGLRPSRCLTG